MKKFMNDINKKENKSKELISIFLKEIEDLVNFINDIGYLNMDRDTKLSSYIWDKIDKKLKTNNLDYDAFLMISEIMNDYFKTVRRDNE